MAEGRSDHVLFFVVFPFYRYLFITSKRDLPC